MSRQRTVSWPVIFLLSCLLALSILAPGSWDRREGDQRGRATTHGKSGQGEAKPAERKSANPDEHLQAPQQPQPAVFAQQEPQSEWRPATETFDCFVDRPLLVIENLHPRIAARPQRPIEQTLEAAAPAWEAEIPAASPVPSLDPTFEIPRSRLESPLTHESEPALPTWPRPDALCNQLQRAIGTDSFGQWAAWTLELVEDFSTTPITDADESARLAKLMQRALREADVLEESMLGDSSLGQLRRLRYALLRHIDVWTASGEVLVAANSAVQPQLNVAALQNSLQEVLALTDASPIGEQWRNYLLLESLDSLARQSATIQAEEQRRLAKTFLARVDNRHLAALQRQFVNSGSIAALTTQLRQLVAEPVDIRDVLGRIESFERTGSAADARLLMADHRRMRQSGDEAARQLSDYIDAHYRNGNFRVVISAKLLNRLAPRREPVDAPIHDTLLGLTVRGRSTTTTDLSVQLVPDEHRLRLAVEATGLVSARTSSRSGPIRLHNRTESNYTVRKDFELTRSGFRSEPARAYSDGNTQLRGLDSDLDGIPFLGRLSRKIARQQFVLRRPQASREIDAKVAQRAERQVEQEVAPRLTIINNLLHDRILVPLERLSLSPDVFQMQTTEERLLLRARLANDTQLASYTPRPQAPADSLASVQMHESAANNLLDKLQLGGRKTSLADLYRILVEKLNLASHAPPESMPSNVFVAFNAEDPIHLECKDGLIKFTLRFTEISRKQEHWRNFTIMVYYRPDLSVRGGQLVREGVVQLAGPRLSMRSQVALRGIFSKVFSENRPIRLLGPRWTDDPRLAGLDTTQFVLEDGWLGWALGPSRHSDAGKTPASESASSDELAKAAVPGLTSDRNAAEISLE